jgi:hypothetical protein
VNQQQGPNLVKSFLEKNVSDMGTEINILFKNEKRVQNDVMCYLANQKFS